MRLLLVWQADPSRTYGWLPPASPGDVLVSFDAVAARHLADRSPLQFDEQVSWEERSAAEHRVSRLVARVLSDPALAEQVLDGYPLSDFIAYRLRAECANVLRGWDAARAAPSCTDVVAGPGTPSALTLGARAALGLPVSESSYVVAAPEVVPPRLRRVFAQATTRAIARVSPAARIRVAAVMAAKVVPALAALTRAQLDAAGIGAMPFPGLDYGNSTRLAARWRRPLLATLDRARPFCPPQPPFRSELRLDEQDAGLEAALQPVVDGLVRISWPQLAAAVQATDGLDRAGNLRALLLPTTAVGASQVLMHWARRRGVTVAAVQHGVYGFKEFDGGDSRADVLFAWSAAVGDQALAWPEPRPRIVAAGAPGMPQTSTRRSASGPVDHVLVATTGRPVESALATTAFHEQFVAAVAPGLADLQRQGVRVELRLHPAEARETYEAILSANGLEIGFASEIPFADAAATTDLLVSAPSSVAFEAAALGVPVLLWTGAMPPDVRREHLVAPLSDDVPGYFGAADEFLALTRGLSAPDAPTQRIALNLADRLAEFATPFDAEVFAAGLAELAR